MELFIGFQVQKCLNHCCIYCTHSEPPRALFSYLSLQPFPGWSVRMKQVVSWNTICFCFQRKSITWCGIQSSLAKEMLQPFNLAAGKAEVLFIALLLCIDFEWINPNCNQELVEDWRHIKGYLPQKARGKQFSCCPLELAKTEKTFETRNKFQVIKFVRRIQILNK